MPEVVVYRMCEEHAPDEVFSPDEQFVAFLFNAVPLIVGGKKTSEFAAAFLPVRFMGDSYETARNKAIAFWESETAKAAAKKEQGRKAGLARRKEAMTNA